MLNVNIFERKKYLDALGLCYKWVHCIRDLIGCNDVSFGSWVPTIQRTLLTLTIALSTVKMEDEGPSVTLVPCYQSTWHHTSQKIVILMVTAVRIPTSAIFGVF